MIVNRIRKAILMVALYGLGAGSVDAMKNGGFGLGFSDEKAGPSEAFPGTIGIIPKPTKVVINEGSFVRSDETPVLIIDNDNTLKKTAAFFCQLFKKDTGLSLSVVSKTNSVSGNLIEFVVNEAYADEAYRLTVADNGIKIEASVYSGFVYGIQSLRQVILLSI